MHVHDLVDYVSEEAEIAGRSAVKYIRGEKSRTANIRVDVDGKVRYTVPEVISEIIDTKLYFRVGSVMRDVSIVVKSGDKVLLKKKKQKLAPAEMETVTLTEEMIRSVDGGVISVSVE